MIPKKCLAIWRKKMGTTNQKQYTSKQAEQFKKEAEKKAKANGWQDMAYKFYAQKGKK